MTRIATALAFFFLKINLLSAATLHVGAGYPYPDLAAAVAAVAAGDTIEIHQGTYPGGLYFSNLKGNAAQWITIRAAADESVIFDGGSNAIQLSDPAYLHLIGITFSHQTGNGFNLDDGGSYDTPAHHIVFEACTFREIAASGNNDLLKLSGLDDFEIRHCSFLYGAAGGSGIDMVGCHRGVIRNNFFEGMGSNAIQCKGGSEHIRIEGNYFNAGGQRVLNLGGSTGLAFFRPDTAHFEAANLQVYSNVFVGGQAAVAFVGSVGVEVVNNTIYLPEKWVIRILQETVDPDRFVECGDNLFRNNIVVRNAGLSTETNIGPNTRPETFTFSNNLWFHNGNPNWAGPSIPTPDLNGIVNQNPLLADPTNFDVHLAPNSPAAGAGYPVNAPALDIYGQTFALPRSIGAAEANPVTGVPATPSDDRFDLYPNPFSTDYRLILPDSGNYRLRVYDAFGRPMEEKPAACWPEGVYFFVLEDPGTGRRLVRQGVKGR